MPFLTEKLPLLELLNIQEPRVRHDSRKTSKQSIEGLKYDSFRAIILYTLSQYANGLTTVELGDILGCPRDYVSPHIKALETIGLLKRDGSTRKNLKTKRKTECEICKITDEYINSHLKKQTHEHWDSIKKKSAQLKLDRMSELVRETRIAYKKELRMLGIEFSRINFNTRCGNRENYQPDFCLSQGTSTDCCQCGERIWID